MKKNLLALAFLACSCAVFTAVAADVIPDRPEKLKFPALNFQPPSAEQYRVQLKSGPVAYVIPDRELPLVNISILVRTGDYLTPAGKEGLANMVGVMLAHGGTTNMTAPQLEERLAFLAAQLTSSVGDTSGKVTLNLLSKDLDEGMSILRDVLATPRFQENKVELRKQQMFQEMRQRNDDTAAIEGLERIESAQKSRLAAARWPDDADHLAARDLQAGPPQHLEAPEEFPPPLAIDHRATSRAVASRLRHQEILASRRRSWRCMRMLSGRIIRK